IHARSEEHPEQDIFQGRVALQQIEILEHVPQRAGSEPIPAALGELREVFTGEENLPRVDLQDAGDDIEECRLAGATPAADGDLLLAVQPKGWNIKDCGALAVRSFEAL